MDGATAQCELIERSEARVDGLRFQLATRAHDAAIRQLLRDTPMQGQINVSMQREPSYFDAAAIEGAEHKTIIALEGDRLIAAGSVSTRQRFINGQPRRVGYLGGLRLANSCRGRASIIRRGYDLLRQIHQDDNGPEIYLTSILADNLPARRLLERGLEGMPAYHFLGEFVTLVIQRRQRSEFFKPTAPSRHKFRQSGLELVYGDDSLVPAILELLNKNNALYQFAPVYSADDLRLPGIVPQDFRLACTPEGKPVTCAAIWDQKLVKQTVVAAYSANLRRMRPLINVLAALSSRPRLPAIGEIISNAFISHVAGDPGRTDLLEWFIDLLHGPAHTREIDYLTIGFDARDPRLPVLRKSYRAREYVSRLYAVHWNDGADLARALDDRLLAPEVALL